MASDFVSIPPDSTGKKIRHYNRLDVVVNNVIGNLPTLRKGDIVIGNSSNVSAKYVGFTVEFNITYIFLTDYNGDFIIGETLNIDGSDVADIVSYQDIYSPTIHISDRDNPYNTQKVANNGTSYVRYNEGEVAFDAFGNMQTTEPNIVDQHNFVYGDTRPLDYYDVETNGGSITADTINSSLLLTVPTASGATVSRTTNTYYPYTPGQGTELLASVRIGDSGKENVVRRIGLFDNENGVYFQISGTTIQVGVRNNSTGSVVDDVVNLDDFNGDPLNDNSSSEFLLDPTKYNLMFIDFQWLGVGRVRFGFYAPSGKRVIMHTVENPNLRTVPYMNSGTLPFKIEQFNTGISASSSEMRLVCAAIIRQSSDKIFPGQYFNDTNSIIHSGTTETPIISFRPKTTFSGKTNRKTVIPADIEILTGHRLQLNIYVNPTLQGSNWTNGASNSSVVEVDKNATGFTGGVLYERLFFNPQCDSLRALEENLVNVLRLGADGVTQPVFTFTVKYQLPISEGQTDVIIRWKEVG